jgi:PadR family transcriptional regulator PadR
MARQESEQVEILQGTLDMLVLRTLIFGPLHGYGIAKAVWQTSNESLQIEFGSLYPALRRLELKGWTASKWEISKTNRNAKTYRLTPAGRKQLVRAQSKWASFVDVVARVMSSEPKTEES